MVIVPAVLCGECGATAILVTGADVYPHRPDLHALQIWRCACGATVGCHAGSTKPKGTPASAETRRARIAAHAAFDPLWRRKMAKEGVSQKRARGSAYKWLADQLGIEWNDCHIGLFDAATAQRVVTICAPYTK
jgi:hypothetical protein